MRSKLVDTLWADKLVVIGCANIGLSRVSGIWKTVWRGVISPSDSRFRAVTYQCANGFWMRRQGRGRRVEGRKMDAVTVDLADVKVFFHFGDMFGLDAVYMEAE